MGWVGEESVCLKNVDECFIFIVILELITNFLTIS